MGPWTRPWDRNYFAYALPWLGDLMSNEYVRGAVTGVGVITIVGGLRELTGAFLTRAPHDADTGDTGDTARPS